MTQMEESSSHAGSIACQKYDRPAQVTTLVELKKKKIYVGELLENFYLYSTSSLQRKGKSFVAFIYCMF